MEPVVGPNLNKKKIIQFYKFILTIGFVDGWNLNKKLIEFYKFKYNWANLPVDCSWPSVTVGFHKKETT